MKGKKRLRIDPTCLVTVDKWYNFWSDGKAHTIEIRPHFSYNREKRFDLSDRIGEWSYHCIASDVNVDIEMGCVTNGWSMGDVCDEVTFENGAVKLFVRVPCCILIKITDNDSAERSSDCLLVKCSEDGVTTDKAFGRNTVISNAINGAVKEMYLRSTPSVDMDELIRLKRNGIINEDDEPIYRRHSIGKDEYDEIVDEYMSAYGIKDRTGEEYEYLIEGLSKGGIFVRKNVCADWMASRDATDRYAELKKLKEMIGEESATKVTELLNAIAKSRRGGEETTFRTSIALGSSPVFTEDGNKDD